MAHAAGLGATASAALLPALTSPAVASEASTRRRRVGPPLPEAEQQRRPRCNSAVALPKATVSDWSTALLLPPNLERPDTASARLLFVLRRLASRDRVGDFANIALYRLVPGPAAG